MSTNPSSAETTLPALADTAIITKPGAAAPTLIATAFGVTDKGKVRSMNEDQFVIAELTKAMRIWQTSLPDPKLQIGEERGHLFLVADGMGGHRAGERASALAVVAIQHFTLNSFKWFFGEGNVEAKRVLAQFQSAFVQADAQIAEEVAEHPELKGMGTTVTMAFQLGAQLCVVHVGDTRAYLYREGELHQLTQDHTLEAEMLRSGALKPGQNIGHRFRHVITNAVGGPDAGVKVEARALEVRAGDRLLLCSDGLTGAVTDEIIAATLAAEATPQAAATALMARATEGAASDNITLVVARFEEATAS